LPEPLPAAFDCATKSSRECPLARDRPERPLDYPFRSLLGARHAIGPRTEG
jgi:hypothetical protein